MEVWTYYRIIRRWRWVIVAAMLTGLVVGSVAYRPGIGDYSASATLQVPSEQRALVPDQSQSRALRAEEALSLIWSEDIANRVIQGLHLTLRPYDFHLRLRAATDPSNPLIHVTMTGRTPAEAAALVNATVDAVAQYDKEVLRRQYTLAREFVERQFAEAQGNLRRGEDAFVDFQQKNQFILDSARSAQIATLQAEQQQTGLRLSEVNARLNGLEAEMKSPAQSEAAIAGNPVVQQLRSDLIGLEMALASELTVHTENHPNVIALKGRIQVVKDRLNSEMGKAVSGALDRERVNLEAQKLALQARKEAIQRVLADTRRELPSVTQKQVQEAGLNRNLGVLSAMVSQLQQRLADARMREQQAQALGGLSVVDHAASAQPNPLHQAGFLLTLSLVLGLLVGAGVAFLLEYLDNSLKTPQLAERLFGTPALAAIPRHNPPFEEAYRALRARLVALETREDPGVFVVTAPKPGTGVSTVVANLGRAFARAGRHTVVVDAALRRPSQHVHFAVPNERGLAEILTGQAALQEVLLPTGITNLWILPSGAPEGTAEAEELLGSERMAKLVAELKKMADVILIDAAPAGVFADAYDLAPLASGVLLALDASRAPRGIEQQVKVNLERVGARILGCVLTKVRPDLVDSYFYRNQRQRPRRSLSPAATTAMVLLVFAAGLGAVFTRTGLSMAATGHAVAHWLALVQPFGPAGF